MIKLAETHGGFATVISRGERDAGTILLLTMYRGTNATLFERMPQLDGTRPFIETRRQDAEKPTEFDEYLARRRQQDPDIWVVEADVADAEQFVAMLPR